MGKRLSVMGGVAGVGMCGLDIATTVRRRVQYRECSTGARISAHGWNGLQAREGHMHSIPAVDGDIFALNTSGDVS